VHPCPFCQPREELLAGALAFATPDGMPVSPGHTLVITRRHVADYFDATPEEQVALWGIVRQCKLLLDERHHPDGYNVGVNCGDAAGQSVPHLHIHVIPRYRGDHPDPRGGVRRVLPHCRAEHNRHHQQLFTGGPDDPLLPHLTDALDRAAQVDLAVAFVMKTGMDAVEPLLRDLLERKGHLRVLTGDYLGVTDPDALARLLDLQESHAEHVELRVFSSQRPSLTASSTETDRSPPWSAAPT
jgi:diadenosine tetraphosphate (Ap4A) HIT family hydrolase